MMEMILVRTRNRLPRLEAFEDHERGIENRHEQDDEREHECERCCGLHDPLDRDAGQQEAEHECARIAHEDLGWIEVPG